MPEPTVTAHPPGRNARGDRMHMLTRRARVALDEPSDLWRIHLATMAVGFLVLLWVNRHQWFTYDEWGFLLDTQLVGAATKHGVLDAANGHWATLTLLIYRIQFRLFGVRTYFPYLVVLAALQTISAHLLWRVMRRCGVDLLVATVGAAAFIVLGAGAEMLTNAYGITNVGPVAAGLGALLVVPDSGRLDRRDLATSVLLLAALMFQSGAGAPFVAVVAFFVCLRRGWRVAAAVIAGPALAFGVWYVAYGRDAAPYGRLKLQDGIQVVPEYVWKGLTAAVNTTTGLSGIAPVIIVIVAFWVVRHIDTSDRGSAMAVALAGGGVLELVLITFGRGGFGPSVVASSRYILIVVPMIMPLVALAASSGLAHTRVRLPMVALVAAILLVVQLSSLHNYASVHGAVEQEQKHRVLAAAQILRRDPKTLWPFPAPETAVPLTNDKLESLDRDGQLPGNVHVTKADLLTARLFIEFVRTRDAPAVASQTLPQVVGTTLARTGAGHRDDCIDVVANGGGPSTVRIHFPTPGNVAIQPAHSGSITVGLARPQPGSGRSRNRDITVEGNVVQYLNLSVGGFDLMVTVPPSDTTELCGLAVGVPANGGSS